MSAISRLKWWYLAYFSKPAVNRPLYKLVREHRPRRILEVGLRDLDCTLQLLDLARQANPTEEIRYTAIDLFEADTTRPAPLKLKQVHCVLKETAVRAQLIPGDPSSALGRSANALTGLDLILIAKRSRAELEKAWFYFPRMLQSNTIVLEETVDAQSGQIHFARLQLSSIQHWARVQERRAA